MPSENIDENAILDAAAEVFAEKGYAGARVEEIASLAKVNKAMLYYRIGDKKELYSRVVLRGQHRFKSTLFGSLESCTTAPETLRAMVRGIALNAIEDSLVPSIFLRELAGRGMTLPDQGLKGIKEFMQIIRSTVTMGIEEGSFRDIDSVALQFMVMGGVFALVLSAEMRGSVNPESPGPLKPEEISSAILEILFRGISAEEVSND